jgi:hypothetical protein
MRVGGVPQESIAREASAVRQSKSLGQRGQSELSTGANCGEI